jgi:dCMP deaminase
MPYFSYTLYMLWKEYFISIAEQVKEKSKDIKTQIGCVIVGEDKEILTTGYNSFPRGLNDYDITRQERPEKYYWFEHAERNAIYNAARIGVSLKRSTAYLTSGLPCMDCARALVQSGVTKIVCKEYCTTKNLSKWRENQERSLILLSECGVEVEFY